MRKAARIVFLFFVGLLSSVFLGVAMALMSAVSLAATALIVPGTGTPNANVVTDYRQHARDYYMQGTACTNNSNCAPNNTGNPAAGGLLGINYPASFWPIPYNNWCPGLTCDTWNVSVGQGVANLHTALTASIGPVVIFGYSQGGAVVSTELASIANDPAQLAKIDKVVTIGGILNPDGGLWSRISFIPYIPILNITPRPTMPVDIPELAGKFYTVGFQYDPVVYAPLYWGNPVAMLNAAAALLNVHGYYLADGGSSLAYGYTPAELAEQTNCSLHKENCRTDKYGNTYVMIPARSLPLTDFIMSIVPSPLAPIVKPFVDLVTPVLKVIADLGYDWSGDPSVVRPLSILPFNPFQNWLEVGVKLVVAAIQGVQAFIGDLVGTSTIAPSTPAPDTLDGSQDTARSLLANDPVSGSTEPPGAQLTSVQDDVMQGLDDGEGDETTVVTTSTDNELATSNGTLTPTAGDTTNVDENVVEQEGEPEEINGGSEEINGGSEELTNDPEELTNDPEELKNNPEELTNDPEELTNNPDELTNDPQDNTQDPEGLTNDPQDNTQDPEESKDPEENKNGASGGSVSLNFSPNKPKGLTGGQATGRPDPTGSPAPTQDTEGAEGSGDPEQAAA